MWTLREEWREGENEKSVGNEGERVIRIRCTEECENEQKDERKERRRKRG